MNGSYGPSDRELVGSSVAAVRWQPRFFAPCMAILTIYGAKIWTDGNTSRVPVAGRHTKTRGIKLVILLYRRQSMYNKHIVPTFDLDVF